VLVGTRGNVPAPAPGEQWPSAIRAAVEGHSAKPERFVELIEGYYPTLPKIELNRRGAAREGWDAWGNEVAAADEESMPADEPRQTKVPIPPQRPMSNDDGLDIPAQFKRAKIPVETRGVGPTEQP
jgi:hypothetical protein